jgi:primosomal protein N' (replication factor Y) (superfamily II helicase)
LMGLSSLTEKKMLIQTASPEHICFQALLKKDPQHFYDEELRQRKQLDYPPYKHMVFVKIRSKKEERAKAFSQALFKRLNEKNTHKDIRIVTVSPGQPPQLRGNFYQQVLLLVKDPRKIKSLLKLCLKDLTHSGIIVTVDVDPQ